MNNHEPPTSGLASVLDLVARELVAARTAPANTPRPQAAPQQPRHGITTIGDFGYRFRSRLEARWAHMFTTLNWDWEYEPVDLDGYIPDFIIKPKTLDGTPILVEIKPATTDEELERPIPKIEKSGWVGPYLVLGTGPKTNRWGDPTIGLIGDTRPDKCEPGTPAAISRCTCGFGIASNEMSYACRICGHYDGSLDTVDYHTIKRYWAQASNDTQWRKP